MINARALKDFVNSMIRPLRNRVYTMITRGIIETANDSGSMQFVKVTLLAGETREDIERIQNFGFSSNPPTSSECVAVAIGGNRDHLIILGDNDRASRIKNLLKGESVQYNSNGNKIHLKNDGEAEMLVDKISITNDTGEVIDLLVQTLEALTLEPFIVNKAIFTDIKTKLESFKV